MPQGILTVPAEGFHSPPSGSIDSAGQLLHAHQSVSQHPDSMLNQDQAASKVSDEPKVNYHHEF